LEEFEEKASSGETTVTQLIIEEGVCTVDELGASLEQYYQVPFMKYDPEIIIDEEILDNLNKSYLAGNSWVPLSFTAEKAVILIDDPNDSERIMDIQNVLTSATYEFLVALKEDILQYLGFEVSGAVKEEEAEERGMDDILGDLADGELTVTEDDSGDDDIADPNASSVVQLVNKIIAEAYYIGTSDIHIEPHKGTRAADVRVRVDGVNRLLTTIPSTHIRAAVARVKVMANLDITESRKPQDGKIAVTLKGKALSRVSLPPGRWRCHSMLSAGRHGMETDACDC
jgi:type II secretory ATPase GspE/PulE/Tfp pilus assembly ATPase PilB-like protein